MLQVSQLRFLDWEPLNLSVEGGECLGISGESGSGKSLLLRAMADLDLHEGRVSLGGVSAQDVSGSEWRKMVGMLPAESRWWFDLVRPHFPEGVDGAVFEELGFVGVEVLDWEVRRLSVGERQRLALARLLAREPKALLLDEPTANLDAKTGGLVEALVAGYRESRGAPVAWVAHDEAQLGRVAGRCVRMAGKQLEAA